MDFSLYPSTFLLLFALGERLQILFLLDTGYFGPFPFYEHFSWALMRPSIHYSPVDSGFPNVKINYVGRLVELMFISSSRSTTELLDT